MPVDEAPITGENVESVVESNLAGRGVVVLHQGAGVIELNFLRHAAEPKEARLYPLEPVGLPSEKWFFLKKVFKLWRSHPERPGFAGG
jgi:hypothetical protein